ncbi:lytic murein transglycosylase B [Azonexus sp.]|uniref:lytic murein transglycosylase B n=1 Tax=Azonexus sp. TaxID=1872668 RepID=UPI0039E247FE
MNRVRHFLAACCLALASTAGAQTIAELPQALAFAEDLAQRQGFSAAELIAQMTQLRTNPRVIQLMEPPSSPGQRSWTRYRARFIEPKRIQGGLRFWQENAATLARARALYGVPEEIIVAIIGVETFYGRITGNFGVYEALATLAFDYPRRAEFFRTELEQFLLMSRENAVDPLTIKGSFAGALGIPQFMPGSLRRYAVDFDNDQRIDLANSVPDAIGSVARFLEQHGWQKDAAIAVPARLQESAPAERWLEAGIRPTLRAGNLLAEGLHADIAADAQVCLIDLVSPAQSTEYWLGLENFYVITRYNRSSFYAMSVFQLAEAMRLAKIAANALAQQ